ncbi:MAG: histidine phosphatase family protein [Chthoniobacterales bacterium]|nr:histidine phosphatase family protein [Chthoniobacterales bacterium]
MRARFLLFALLASSVQVLAAQSSIFLVRHAEKAAGDGADAQDPDLSEAGRARAESLALMLRDAHLTAIYATEFKRTQQTAAPVARAAGLEVTTIPAKETATLVSKLKEREGNALVIGHSNTLPEIIKLLRFADSIIVEESEYDSLFVLTHGLPPQLLRLHYR